VSGSLTDGNGHCRDQPGGCTEFQLLRQEVKSGLLVKVTEVGGFEDKPDRLM
jgi:hypothetical protein